MFFRVKPAESKVVSCTDIGDESLRNIHPQARGHTRSDMTLVVRCDPGAISITLHTVISMGFGLIM